ncbi:MAG: hypothetical protein KDB63_14875, partial [Nocardioidaceae bacterium]|nr:hypothetical protein [Nocardioidaceae bacterium]
MTRSRRATVLATAVITTAGVLGLPAAAVAGPTRSPEAPTRVATEQVSPDTAPPLAGRVIVLDPGHQLGNHN